MKMRALLLLATIIGLHTHLLAESKINAAGEKVYAHDTYDNQLAFLSALTEECPEAQLVVYHHSRRQRVIVLHDQKEERFLVDVFNNFSMDDNWLMKINGQNITTHGKPKLVIKIAKATYMTHPFPKETETQVDWENPLERKLGNWFPLKPTDTLDLTCTDENGHICLHIKYDPVFHWQSVFNAPMKLAAADQLPDVVDWSNQPLLPQILAVLEKQNHCRVGQEACLSAESAPTVFKKSLPSPTDLAPLHIHTKKRFFNLEDDKVAHELGSLLNELIIYRTMYCATAAEIEGPPTVVIHVHDGLDDKLFKRIIELIQSEIHRHPIYITSD